MLLHAVTPLRLPVGLLDRAGPVAEGCSGDVSCAARFSGRGPQAAALCCRGGPAAMRGRGGLRPVAVGCGHVR